MRMEARSLSAVRAAADSHNPAAAFELALRYQDGLGLPADAETAVAWMQRAAADGHALAQYNLGILCLTGRGTPPDPTRALSWLRASAEQGSLRAAFMLGTLYYEGVAGDRALEEACKWLDTVAVRGGGIVPTWPRTAGLHDLTPEQVAEARYLARRARAESAGRPDDDTPQHPGRLRAGA